MQTGDDGLTTGRDGRAGLRIRALAWWLQFPAPLREVASLRLIGSIGAGAVLYLTPLVFHQEDFSASSVTLGVAIAALAGTLGRFLSGLLLDRGVNCGIPVLLACFAALAADSHLFAARSFPAYAQGQVLMGIAMGLYWPAIELAVPLGSSSGSRPIPSARGFALARSADAAGVALGALIGALLASRGQLRGIYLLDMLCLSTMVLLLLLRRLPDPPASPRDRPNDAAWRQWLPPLLPVLLITLLATALPALMQSALPLDLVRGGLRRAAMPSGLGALLIGLQLGLLLLLQWPVGQWLARRPVATGLALSLASFALGTATLALSALSSHGLWLVALAQVPLALGLAAFLPTATEAVIELTPAKHQGVAMALFSQCFAISGLVAPPLAGLALDQQGHGSGLWLLFALLCLPAFQLARRLRPAASAG
jgi:MFS family permease